MVRKERLATTHSKKKDFSKSSAFMCFFNHKVLGISISSCQPYRTVRGFSMSTPKQETPRDGRKKGIERVLSTHAHHPAYEAQDPFPRLVDERGLFLGPMIRPEDHIPIPCLLACFPQPFAFGHTDGNTLSIDNA
jgi:hypothetical protein